MNPLHGMIRMGLKNPYLVLALILLVLVLGIVSLFLIPADLLPIFDTPAVQIITFYPGMPAEVMERDIMSRLQRWTGQSVGIEHQEAKAMLGVCVVKNFFHEGISLDTAMSQVTSYAMSDMFYLPPGTIPPMVMPFDPTAMTPLCLVGVSSETLSEKRLYDIAYFELRNRLQSISGVIAPAVYGGKLRRILAYVDRDSLRARGMDPLDVVDALGKWNTLIPTGNAKLGPFDYQIVANGMVRHVEDLDDVPIKFFDEGRQPVFLRDVGHVEDSSQIQTNVVRVNGRRQAYIPIYRQPGSNSLEIVRKVEELLPLIGTQLVDTEGKPEDVNLDVVFNQAKGIEDSIRELEKSALIGGVLAAIVILIFLRSILPSVAVLITIPLAVLGTFAGLRFAGQSINIMTLGGVALAVGVMVDQAIVLMENILRHLRMGKPPLEAAWDGGREVATPVMVSTFTFIAVFFPVIFLSGMVRFLFVPLALAVIFGMVSSYLLAMLIIPSFSSRFFRASSADAVEKARIQAAGGNRLLRGYRSVVGATVAHPWLTLAVTVAILGTTYYPFSQLGWELFPRSDHGQFTIFVRAPSGTRIELTEEIVAEVEKTVYEVVSKKGDGVAGVASASGDSSEDTEVELLISNIGVLMDWPAAYTWNSGPMDTFMLVQLKEDRTRSAQQQVERLRKVLPKRFPGVEFAFDTAGMLTTALNFGLPSPIDVKVQGTSGIGYDRAHDIAKVLRNELAQIDGAVDVRIQQKLDYPQVSLTVDREKAARYGLTLEDVVKNIVTATNSSINFKPAFWIDEGNGNHYFMGAQYREEAIDSFETLENLPINSPTMEKPIALKDIAKLTLTTAPAEITHRNITRMIDIFINVAGHTDVGSVSREVDRVLEEAKNWVVVEDGQGLKKVVKPTAGSGPVPAGEKFIPQGFSVSQWGEFETFSSSFASFGFGFGLAAVIVYLILIVLFRSFREPLVILFSVPLGLIGVGWILYATDTTLNIQAFMGIILMVGLVVEYGIILVDFMNRLRKEGKTRDEAIVEAATIRLRPILMTSLTTALALVPMAFFGGPQGGANASLARTILGGVVAATILTLLATPALYRLLARREFVPEPELSP